MVVVLRSGAFRVVIYLDDHEPAPVHVYGHGQAKIDIAGARPRLIETTMARGELRKVAILVAENHSALLRRWREVHG